MAKLFFSFFVFCATSLFAHDYHVTVVQIDYNKESQSLEVTYKLFIDDLELALKEKGHDKLYIGTPEESVKTDEHILEYLNHSFQLKVNGESKSLNLIGKEADYHEIHCYVEILNVSTPQEIEVFSSIFTEILDDQSNRINFNINGVQKSLTLNKINLEGSVSFE